MSDHTDDIHNPNDKKLQAHFEKIIRLEKEKKAAADAIKDEYALAKSDGYDPKLMRKAIAQAKKNADEKRLEDDVLPIYELALEKSRASVN